MCDDAFTAREILDAIDREHTSALHYGGGGGSTPLTLRIRYEGGALVCDPAIRGHPVSRTAIVEIAVVVEIATGDGAFHERMPAVLRGFPGVGSFEGTLPAEEIVGSHEPDLPGCEEVRIRFQGWCWERDTDGLINARGVPPDPSTGGCFEFVGGWGR